MARLFALASSQSMQNLNGIVPGEPLTVSCWVKETTQVVGVIFWLGNKDVTNERYQLYLGAGSGNKLACFAQDAGASGESVTTAATTAGVWQHCAGVWASETSRTAYLNGVAATPNTTAISPSNMDAVALGFNKGSVAAYLDAAVAEVAVHRAILDAAELTALSKGVSPLLIRPSLLIAYWPLFGVDSPEPDRWRNAYALTLTNAPTKADHPRIYMPAGWVPTQYRPYASLAATATIEFTASAALSTTVALSATAEITFTARGHLERATWLEPTPIISVDGVLRGTGRPVEGEKVLEDVTVTQEMDHAPNRCSFVAVGFEPRIGSRVIVVLGDIDNPSREFIGSVINVTQLQQNESGLIRFAVNCVDDTWKLTFTRVIGETFLSQSWTDTLLALLAKYAPWVDTSGVEDGMDSIDEISFENGTSLESAITQGCKRIGVYWDMDGTRLLCGTELDPIEPAWLTPMSFEGVTPDALSVQRDGSQIVTRVIFECGGSTALVDVQPGETVLPVLTTVLYDEDGGEVISGKTRARFTSIDPGTTGTIVGTGATPSSAPDATATVGTELSPGTRDYAATFVTAAGETLIGPRVSVSVGLEVPVSPPPTALTPTLTAGSGVDVGSHTYGVTFVDSLGNETTSSPVSVPVTTWPHISDPGTLPSFTFGTGSGGALTIGNTYKWKITYFNASTGGETLPSSESFGATDLSAAAIADTANATTYVSGSFTPAANRLYLLAVVHSDAAPETTVPTITTTTGLTFVQVGSSIVFNTIGSNLHRITLFRAMKASGLSAGTYTVTLADEGTGCCTRLTEVSGVVTTGTDGAGAVINISTNNADATANPSVTLAAFNDVDNGTYACFASDISSAPTAGSGFTTLGHSTIGTPTKGVFAQWRATNDTSADCTLASSDWAGIAVELVQQPGSPAAYTVVDASYTRAFIPLTAFAAVPTGYTRRWYRQENDTGSFKRCTDFLIVVIGGVTYFSDGQSQASLEAAAPTSNTTLRMQVSLTGIAIGPAGVTSRKVYRTPVASSQLKLLTTIANNTATTLIDNTPDVNLGADILSSSGTTTGRVELSDIPIGATDVTSRNVYRTVAGGSTLKLLTAIADNSTSSLVDATADGSLGATEPPLVDTSGLAQPQGQVVAGSSAIPIAGTATFREDGGWVSTGDQLVRYAGKTSTALTGIPTSGPGSITATISYNASITTTPALIGIPASGPGSITTLIPKGQDVNMLVTVDSTVGQAALAEAFGEDVFDDNIFDSNIFDTEINVSSGVVEEYVQDRRLTVEEARARAMAILALRELPAVSVSYPTRHRLDKAGRIKTAMLPAPKNVEGRFRIQRVTISGFSPTLHPLRHVLASNQSLASFENLLRGARNANRAQNV